MRRSHFRVLRAAQRVDQAALIRLTLPGAGGLDRAVGDYLEREIDEIGAHELNVDHDQPVNRPCLRVVIDPEPVEHVGEVLAKPRDALDVAVDGGRAAISRLERLLKLIRKLGGCLRYRKILCLDCRQSLPARIGNEDVNVTKILTSPALKAQPPNLLDLPLDYQRRISLVEFCNSIVAAAQTVTTTLPRARPSLRYRMASATSLNANVLSTTGLTVPASKNSRNTCRSSLRAIAISVPSF
jgi:hypothetical protein